jgi:succinate dehydrogenase / fumarate reductase membrane anchor subunit
MKDCTKHWWLQRLSALPLIPLFFYFLGQTEHLAAKDRMEFVNWAKQPVPAAALLLFILCAFYHARLGMEEIIEDYIPDPAQKTAALLVNKVFFFGLGLASFYAVTMIRFGSF